VESGRHRLRALVAYDGGPFHGFAANLGVRTVAGDLTDALQQILGADTTITCAGRTDKGVHGWGQVISFDAPTDHLAPTELRRALNHHCGPAIVVRAIEAAPADFDARFDAIARIYRYRILQAPVADPFRATTHWHVDQPLELAALRAGIEPLLGEHDFSSFCRRPAPGPRGHERTLVRRVMRARWREQGDRLTFEIEASAFCQQMVRAIVGTLVEVGRGRRRAGDLAGILAGRDRGAAGQLAPPHGLMLWRVRYADEPGWVVDQSAAGSPSP